MPLRAKLVGLVLVATALVAAISIAQTRMESARTAALAAYGIATLSEGQSNRVMEQTLGASVHPVEAAHRKCVGEAARGIPLGCSCGSSAARVGDAARLC